jgi:hypothetical protein
VLRTLASSNLIQLNREVKEGRGSANNNAASLSVALGHYINRVGRTDVAARLKIVRRPVEREPVQRYNLGPSHFDGEAAAHDQSF